MQHIKCFKHDKIFYGYTGKVYKLREIYSLVEKRKGNKDVLVSALIYCYGIPVRIVFVRNRNKDTKRKWLAILSTDLSISEEEIIRIYVCNGTLKSALR